MSASRIGFRPEEIDPSASTREVPLKWVVVIDEALPPGRAANAAVCVAAATNQTAVGLLGEDAKDASGAIHPGLPWIGCTVLGAPSARISEIRARAAAQPEVALVDMPTQAQHTRVYADYLFGVSRSRSVDLSYYAVSLVGPRKLVDKLVKGLQLLP
jgi:hypothetical protein